MTKPELEQFLSFLGYEKCPRFGHMIHEEKAGVLIIQYRYRISDTFATKERWHNGKWVALKCGPLENCAINEHGKLEGLAKPR